MLKNDICRNQLPLQKCINGECITNLSDSELLAIIIGTGSRNRNVFELSDILLRNFGNLQSLMSAGIREIAQVTGIGIKKAVRIHAALEIGRRAVHKKTNISCIDSPKAVWELLMPQMAFLEKEEFFAIALNNKNCILKKERISVGTLNEAIVHPREVFRSAIREGASGVIIAHNHPSGNLTPSYEDIRTTERLSKVGELVGIRLLDHVIITNSSFLSLKECGHI